jgi:hypothetical protein
VNEDLFNVSINMMARNLKANLCGLHHPAFFATEADNDSVQKCLPMEVQYACRYCIFHLQHSAADITQERPKCIVRCHDFLETHLLHWLKALSIMRKSFEAIIILRTYRLLLTVSGLFARWRNVAHPNAESRPMSDLKLRSATRIMSLRLPTILYVLSTSFEKSLQKLRFRYIGLPFCSVHSTALSGIYSGPNTTLGR